MNNEKENIKSLYIKASEVEPKEVRWLWYPYIPYGKVTIIQGIAGDGKSTFMLTISALLTKGVALPFSQEEAIELLDNLISGLYQNPVNIRQARTILINMWYRPDDWFLAQSLQAAEGLTAFERTPLHWALLIKRYQFFYDLASSIGRLFEFRDEISIDLIRTRIFEIWGEKLRTAFYGALSK